MKGRRKVCLFVFLFFVVMPFVALSSNISEDSLEKKRSAMVERDIRGRGIKNTRVLNAMLKIKRHLFIDEAQWSRAYDDHPLPIGEGQTISQPYVVALMTEAVGLMGDEKVLEIGTGSGYQAAILAELAKHVFTIEINKSLYEQSRGKLEKHGFKNVQTKHGDGYFGWEDNAPFDVIMVTASANHVPPPLT